MTIREHLADDLLHHGLWPKEAAAVLDIMEAEMAEMKHRWDELTEAYPPPMLAVLLVGAKAAAVKWIDANAPKHFARRILQGEPVADSL